MFVWNGVNLPPYYQFMFILSLVMVENISFTKLIVAEHVFNQSGVSLAFVFDVTGSMASELDQVKSGAKKILKTISENNEKIIHNYIFVPFGDPNIGPWIATNNTTKFREILGEITVERGGDCPEMSLSGIKKSLELCLQNSYIYVFTDAHSKDFHLLSDILELIQKKNSQIVFVLTGNCNDDDSDPQEFVKIAAVSTGQIFNLLKHDVHQVLEFIRLSLRSHKVNLLSVDASNKTNGINVYNIPIDETLKELTISLAGKKTLVNISDPYGNRVDETTKVQVLLSLEKIKIINIADPKPGLWRVSVRGLSHYTLRTTGQSNFTFIHGFSVEWITSMNETNHRPIKDLKNYLFVTPSNLNYSIQFTVCEIVTLNGIVINTIWLKKARDIDNTYFGIFFPNNTNFHLQISGISKNGTVVRRITTSAVSTESAKMPIITLPMEEIVNKSQTLFLNCKVDSLVPYKVRWYKNGEFLNSSQLYNQSAVIHYELSNTSISDAGNYSCEVSNINGTVTAFTNVQVIDLPFIKQNLPEKIIVKLDEDYGIPCSAKGFPQPIIRWMLNHTILVDGYFNDNVAVLPDKTLLIMNALPNNSGIYSCIAENKAGKDYRHYEIIIVGGTTLEDGVTLIQVKEAQNAVFKCPVSDNSSNIQWLRNHFPLDMKCNDRADEPRYLLNNNSRILKILEVRFSDHGYYTCMVTYLFETVQHHFFLEILIAPYFYDFVEDISLSVRENEEIMLNCTADGYPTPKTVWKKNDLIWPVNNWTLPNCKLFKPNKQSLLIRGIKKEIHLGNYTCLVKNKVAMIQRSFKLNL